MHRFQRGRVITHNFENSVVGGQVKTKTFENSDGEFYSFGVDNGRKRVERYPFSNENSVNGQNDLKMLVGTKTLSYVFGHVKTESFENPFQWTVSQLKSHPSVIKILLSILVWTGARFPNFEPAFFRQRLHPAHNTKKQARPSRHGDVYSVSHAPQRMP